MDDVSIILEIRHCTGNNYVEIVGECEKKYSELALYGFAAKVIQKARKYGGKMLPWTHEPQFQKFCYSFEFKKEEEKKEFLMELLTLT